MTPIKFNMNMRIISMCFLILILVLMFSSVQKVKNINTLIHKKASIEVNRKNSADQYQILSSASDYLTSQMWHFIATGKTEYLDNYWNEVNIARNRDKATEKLLTLNLTEEEKSLLLSAKKESDNLILKEAWAMRLICEGIGIDEKHMPKNIADTNLPYAESILPSNKKNELAMHYVLGGDYTSSKKNIKSSFGEFYVVVSERTDKELSSAIGSTQGILNQVQLYNVIILVLFFTAFILFYTLVMRPFHKYATSLNHLDESNPSPLRPSGSKEMRAFANIFNNIYFNWQVQNEHLKKLNLIDPLTGIPNRKSLYSYVDNALNDKSKNLGLLIMDVDFFKAFNDNYGHLAGDKVLVQIGLCLSEAVPDSLGIAGRLSGEEFLIAVPGTNAIEVDTIANNILKKIRSIDMKHAGLTLTDTRITASIGSVLCEVNETCTTKDLIHKADLALYKAKGNGKNQHIMFIPNNSTFIYLETSHEHDVEVEREMHSALENGEFIPYFQPKYNITSGDIVGLEALVRWNHPVKGILSPGYFVPLFERNGFITKTDFYIFENVCKIIKTWLNEGKNVVPIACNFSRLHFKEPLLSTKLKEIVDKYNIPPSYIEIEVTETSLIDDNDIIVKELSALQKMGFSVAIDDFGVGYSSLGILMELPVDVLKLDRSFLQRDLSDRKNIMLISGILYISRILNLKTVCEGVETKQQLDVIRKTGCNIAQGYYFSKPVNQAEIEKLLYENHPTLPVEKHFTFSSNDALELVPYLLQLFFTSPNVNNISLYVTSNIKWETFTSSLFGIDMLLDYHQNYFYGNYFMLTTYSLKTHYGDNSTIIVSGEGTLSGFSGETISSKNFSFNSKCILSDNTLKVDELNIVEMCQN